MISLGTDLGLGQPMEHVMRQSLIALRLAERLGLDEAARGGRVLRRAARLGRLPRRRVRAGEVVRRRPGAQGRRPRSSTWPAWPARAFILQPSRAPGAGLAERARLGVAVPRRRAPRRRRDAREPLAGDERAGRRARPRRGRARRPAPDVRALGRQGRAGGGQGRGDPRRRAAGDARRRGRGLPPRRRRRRRDRRRSRAQRHPVRPGPGGPLLRRGADAVRRPRRGDDVAGA